MKRWVRIDTLLGPNRLKFGSESSWGRKILRVRNVLGSNRPATPVGAEPAGSVFEENSFYREVKR